MNLKGAETLFQEKTGSIMDILAHTDLERFTDNDRASVAVAREQATKWIADNSSIGTTGTIKDDILV